MTTPTTPPPQQGQSDGQQQGSDDRPSLEELRQQSAELSEAILKHLGRWSN
ncbi:hypothetical protein ACFV2X_43565 [Streptomyces sp. NPDC059679]|uniref:hypothetical protein n=1 Tax=Streptomyces sp. NPDC059679 TaxID=3346903 RepID=UPI0036B94E05